MAAPLRHRRDPEQWHPRDRRLPLGARRRLPPNTSAPTAAASTSRTIGSSTTHQHQLRLRRKDDHLGRAAAAQGQKINGRERGSSILGTKGSIIIDRDGYEQYDWSGKLVDEYKTGKQTSSADTVGRDSMTDAHFLNFINAIKHDEKLNSPITIANVSVTILQLSNVAYFTGHKLTLDQKTGHVLNNPEAMKLWGRDYEKGWEVTV